jgi:hypothetical protein
MSDTRILLKCGAKEFYILTHVYKQLDDAIIDGKFIYFADNPELFQQLIDFIQEPKLCFPAAYS